MPSISQYHTGATIIYLSNSSQLKNPNQPDSDVRVIYRLVCRLEHHKYVHCSPPDKLQAGTTSASVPHDQDKSTFAPKS